MELCQIEPTYIASELLTYITILNIKQQQKKRQQEMNHKKENTLFPPTVNHSMGMVVSTGTMIGARSARVNLGG
jgi:hypothetical protein